jgi:hypothetical protein
MITNDDSGIRLRGHGMTPLLLLLAGASGIGAEPITPMPVPVPVVAVSPVAVETVLDIDSYDPQPGDIILYLTYGPLRRVGAHALCGGASHAAIVVPRSTGGVALLETPTVGSSVQLNNVKNELRGYWGTLKVRRRHTPMTAEQWMRLQAFAEMQVGKPYDLLSWVTFPLSFPVDILTHQTLTNDAVMNRQRWICSSLVGGACMFAGLIDPTGLRPHSMLPCDFANDRLVNLSGGWDKPVQLVKSR